MTGMGDEVPEPIRLQTDVGATAAEYSLMVGLITLVIFGSVAAFGGAVANLFIVPL